ncbi:PH domain-containing protein [Prauserella endophytica]|uniref:PH domain-containing protein n=1 Tax=Prauserella endophytica TaxID=1592324 RepID=A0ABY2S9G3_9PSEU|nr:PH domain-containing protein [Prauserella endophytica]TKG71939.1 PH domain-containing protein [Prauserella endophytica]
MADEPREQQTPQAEGRRAVFRVPPTALLTIPILLFCVTPAAFAAPGLQALYILPIAVIVLVAGYRTTATRQGLAVRSLFQTRELAWSDLKGLAITPKSKVQAVLNDGTKVALPSVRTRHIPVLSLVSEGTIADPSGVLDQPEKPEKEEPATEAREKAGETVEEAPAPAEKQ